MADSGEAHILVFPYPAQGHMLPLLDLTHQLAIRKLTITILITPKNLPILKPLLTTHPSIKTLILPFPNHPSIPPGVENCKDLPPPYFSAMARVMAQLHQPILNWFRSNPSPPIAILSDFFLGWTRDLASELGIPRIVFSSSGALNFCITGCLWRELPKSDDLDALISFPNVPNSPVFPWKHLSSVYRRYMEQHEGEPEWVFIKDGFLANSASWGIVFNSFDALEGVYLDHLRRNDSVHHRRIWAVGPLSLPAQNEEDDSSSGSRGGGSQSDVGSNVLSWLDTCPDHSVVYVCFGSQAVLKNRQMEELAVGLEKSGVRFVWSIKEPTAGHVAGEYGVVPIGFEDRVEGRGQLVRGWAPQVLLLKHRAVGSFLTHCGWNSVLESIGAGVPMLAWPLTADQFLNAKLLVDEMGAAIRVCEGQETIPNATKLARAFTESISENWPQRVRAKELTKAASQAVKEAGSSCKELDDLVNAISKLDVAKT